MTEAELKLIMTRFDQQDDRLGHIEAKVDAVHDEARKTNGRVTKIEKRHEHVQAVRKWAFRTTVAMIVSVASGAGVALVANLKI